MYDYLFLDLFLSDINSGCGFVYSYSSYVNGLENNNLIWNGMTVLTVKHETMTQCWFNAGHRQRRLLNINPALGQCHVFAGKL